MNPDFFGVDEVTVKGPMGWGEGENEVDIKDFEERFLDRVNQEMPALANADVTEPDPRVLEAWNDFQQAHGRYPGSADWSLLDLFIFGNHLLWLPQIIGSCVCSNTLRPWVTRALYQVRFLGQAKSLLGSNEFSSNNLSFYGPFSYGHARKKANMRRGDGLYCAPFKWTLAQGVLKCDNPQLLRILQSEGFADVKDFPEPQGRDGAAFYRKMGNWSYIDELEQYIDWPVTKSLDVKSADQLWDQLDHCETAFVCSMEAIHKVGTHQDGFPIHARNPRDSWAHNMSCNGKFVASNGDRFFRWCNQSWGEKHNYNRRFEEVADSFRRNRLTMASIGNINLSSSAPMLP